MTNKTKVTITYDDDSTESLEISSAQVLTETLTALKATGVEVFLNVIDISRMLDKFLRNNDIKKLEFEEEAE